MIPICIPYIVHRSCFIKKLTLNKITNVLTSITILTCCLSISPFFSDILKQEYDDYRS